MMRASPQLVSNACAGDSQAISALLIACQPDLKRFARRVCQLPEDAEDAVQVALWQIHRKIGMLQAAQAFTRWVYRIVERECYFLSRRRLARELSEVDINALQAADASLDLRLDLAAAIADLPTPYRTVLILRDVDELTAPEVAELLDISVSAVKSRLHRARAMVRERLGRGAGYAHSAP